MSVYDEFKLAVYLIRNGPKKENTTNEERLKYYALFKQATEGDCNTSQPWAVQVVERAKWDAWNALKGTSKNEAMKRYVELVSRGDPRWRDHDVLKNYQG